MGRQKTQLPLFGELRDPGGWRRARDTEREVDASCLALWSRARAAWCRWAPWGTATLQKPQQHRGQGAAGKVTSSTNPGSSGHGLLWKYLCVRCFIFFVRMGVKELEMCPAFSGSRQKVVIQYAKDFLWVLSEGKAVLCSNPVYLRKIQNPTRWSGSVSGVCVRGCQGQNPAPADTAFTVNL